MRRAPPRRAVKKGPSQSPTSLRLSPETRRAVEALARQRGESLNAALRRIIDEGVRMARCPGILFADGPSGRRACIAGTGIDVWEVTRTLRSCQGNESAMRALYPQLTHAQITSALRYAKTFPDEIAERIAMAETAEIEAMEAVPFLKVS